MMTIHPVFNIFDETTTTKQNSTMQLDRNIMPRRIADLMDEDFIIVPQYCANNEYLAAFRMDAVDNIYHMAVQLGLGMSSAWSGVRLFDMFYAKTTNSSWQLHTPITAMVCLNIAGKCVGHDQNPCGHPATLQKMHEAICMPSVEFERFRHLFLFIEKTVLTTLEFDILMPTPEEYMSECSCWFDSINAARGSPKRPEVETKAARMTSYIVAVIMHSPDSMLYTALEISGYASYIATSATRSAPQTHIIDPPTMTGLWSLIAWTRSNALSRVFTASIEAICAKNQPQTALARMYVEEHAHWKSTCTL
jgi:hypothetical protein